ncbi:hypothetical protein AAFF_G00113870 [Aldrovandia affinis]|uniref:Uncharacterized protein n=1 Tax=Aldrovandia affinis TaxID=143900 RepID=A0AAD7RT81_9TELE|nr:hypothetical protein AAFF_G00113870 [Aldrovandia affinis]
MFRFKQSRLRTAKLPPNSALLFISSAVSEMGTGLLDHPRSGRINTFAETCNYLCDVEPAPFSPPPESRGPRTRRRPLTCAGPPARLASKYGRPERRVRGV